jgi:hypothetical protein
LDCLEYYHSKEQVQGGAINDNPVHDEFSHGADSIRTMAEADRLGMIEGTSNCRVGSGNARAIMRDPNPHALYASSFTKRSRAVIR